MIHFSKKLKQKHLQQWQKVIHISEEWGICTGKYLLDFFCIFFLLTVEKESLTTKNEDADEIGDRSSPILPDSNILVIDDNIRF